MACRHYRRNRRAQLSGHPQRRWEVREARGGLVVLVHLLHPQKKRTHIFSNSTFLASENVIRSIPKIEKKV